MCCWHFFLSRPKKKKKKTLELRHWMDVAVVHGNRSYSARFDCFLNACIKGSESSYHNNRIQIGSCTLTIEFANGFIAWERWITRQAFAKLDRLMDDDRKLDVFVQNWVCFMCLLE